MIITRWIWGPTELIDDNPTPVCREYAIKWTMPHLSVDGMGLTQCELTSVHWEAAQQDETIVILPSLFSNEKIPLELAKALEQYGVNEKMCVAEMLEQLGRKCSIRFTPLL